MDRTYMYSTPFHCHSTSASIRHIHTQMHMTNARAHDNCDLIAIEPQAFSGVTNSSILSENNKLCLYIIYKGYIYFTQRETHTRIKHVLKYSYTALCGIAQLREEIKQHVP